jgi:hypothetical protein
MRTTDGTVGLMIANAANEGVIRHAAVEKVLEILDAIARDAQTRVDEAEPGFERQRLLAHRVDLCEGIRSAIEHRLERANDAPEPKDTRP